MVKKRGLGKSLDALLAYANTESETVNTITSETMTQLSVDKIQRGKYQPRREMDAEALEELAHSIRTQGIIQPLIVRPIGNHFEIIAGERRFRAAQIAGLTEVPVVVKDVPDEAAMAMALIENIQREDLNPIEEAFAFDRLLEEFGMTHQQVADAVGKSRTSVTNLLRLLALPEDVRDMLARGLLEMGHARTLITLPPQAQLQAAKTIIEKGLSVRETENMVRRLQTPTAVKSSIQNPDILNLQESLAKQLKLKVAIQCNAKGRGKLVIHYKSLAELDGILAQFED